MTSLAVKAALSAVLLVGAVGASSQSIAMPALNGAAATQAPETAVQRTRWVCGPYRCWWRPGPYYDGGYGPGPGPALGYYGGPPRWGWGHPGWGWRRHYW